MDKVFACLGIAYLLAVAWPLTKIDLKEHRLPNRLVLPAFPIILAGQLAAEFVAGQWWRLALSFLAAALALALGMLANRAAGLGMGDVKLISAITFALAWFSPIIPLVALLLAFVIAAAVVIVNLIRGKSKLSSTIALGPYLLLGFAVSLPSLVW